MSSENGIDRRVQLIKVEDSPFSMSDEDTPDSLEIKPPQASIHKSYSHRSHREKHSSHRSHSSNQDSKSNSSSQHKSHHRSRHRDERERRHHHKEKERERNKINQNLIQSDREVPQRQHRHREEERKHKEERKKKQENNERKSNKYIEQLRAKEADLRAKLERKKYLNPLKEKEKLERELRKERLLEAERVKEAYKERVKDVEQKRKRYRTRSRSRTPNRSKNDAYKDGSPSASRSRKEMEEAGLVVLTDESRSPTPQRETPNRDSPQDELMNENQQESRQSDKDSQDSQQSSSSSDEDDTGDSSSESEAFSGEDRDTEEESGVKDKRHKSTDESDGDISPHIIVSTNNHDMDMDIELEKDTLPPYLPAIQGCRSVEEFKCLNRIEEGTYGVVYRAKDKRTEEIVALKRLKMEKEKEGFPITSLREINTLLKAQHPNIVTVREIVVGSNMDKIFIVMDYVEHDIKSLMETMKLKKQVFMPGEVKCLMQQLLNAVAHLHDNWILHRDLKTSNLLLSHKGILKVGDFGLAREYGSPLKHYTPIVVTLWYRSPELLLGAKEYSTPIDVWSVGCIFAEFLAMEPLFPGKSDLDQLNRIFKTIGTPSEKVWTGYNKLPACQKMTFAEYQNTGALKLKLSGILTDVGYDLLMKFLTYDPVKRITAEEALKHDYFTETPLPIDPAMFPTWPAKSELGHKKAMSSPKPPSGGQNYKQLEDTEEGFHMGLMERSRVSIPGFSLKF